MSLLQRAILSTGILLSLNIIRSLVTCLATFFEWYSKGLISSMRSSACTVSPHQTTPFLSLQSSNRLGNFTCTGSFFNRSIGDQHLRNDFQHSVAIPDSCTLFLLHQSCRRLSDSFNQHCKIYNIIPESSAALCGSLWVSEHQKHSSLTYIGWSMWAEKRRFFFTKHEHELGWTQ